MYVRLAFAVAAHLEPEILIVDEVLAVGDAEFQARCLGRMEDIGEGGRTVVFVSHNMQAVAQLCDRALLIEGGQHRQGRPERGRRRALPPDQHRDELEPLVDDLERRRRRDLVRLSSVRRQARRRDCRLRRRVASPSGSSSLQVLVDGPPVLPKIKLVADGQIAFNAMDIDPGGTSLAARRVRRDRRGSRATT